MAVTVVMAVTSTGATPLASARVHAAGSRAPAVRFAEPPAVRWGSVLAGNALGADQNQLIRRQALADVKPIEFGVGDPVLDAGKPGGGAHDRRHRW
ncbi:hypothetical protein [Mycobacterium sp. 852014-52144_SCH5372336]|uniref:hypothetical protein n=1 Tax=Mycobacterium sp. 852014-52144_SCH5372336 TaxID=1834115 RepID=UPI000A9B40ED|nr:hypothetical protein [Mycobacterium sp. 852014-52144_SCH5372336]